MNLDREQIIEALDVAGYDEEAIYDDYSGRGMYGATCLGVVLDASGFALFCAALGANADDWDFLGGVRSDSMGLSTIWYWPGVTFAKEEA